MKHIILFVISFLLLAPIHASDPDGLGLKINGNVDYSSKVNANMMATTGVAYKIKFYEHPLKSYAVYGIGTVNSDYDVFRKVMYTRGFATLSIEFWALNKIINVGEKRLMKLYSKETNIDVYSVLHSATLR